jgi:hypothetical protein
LPLEAPHGDPTALTGFQAPFKATECSNLLMKHGHYTAAINALWAVPTQSITPGVPIMEAAVEKMRRTLWPNGKPKPMKQPIDIVVSIGTEVVSKGGATRVSPEEGQHALIIQVAERIRGGADVAEQQEWLRVLLSCPGNVLVLPNQDAQYFHVQNARDEAKRVGLALQQRTTVIIIDIYNFKTRKEHVLGALTNKYIAKLYEQHLSDNSGDESRAAPSTIEACLTVYERMFKDRNR